MKVLEGGKDTRDIVESYYQLEKKYEKLQKKSEYEISCLKSEVKKLTKKLNKREKIIKTQQEKIVNPLIKECTRREEYCQWMREQLDAKTKSLKILYAMIRSPKLCDMLQKAERKYLTQERLKQVQESAILTLRQYRFDQNVNQFVDQVYGAVTEQLTNTTDPFLSQGSPKMKKEPDTKNEN